MKRSRFTGERTIAILREHEAGAAELCRKHEMSSATFYAWKAKYGGMNVLEAKRLKALKAENAKLKTPPCGRHTRQYRAKEAAGKKKETPAAGGRPSRI